MGEHRPHFEVYESADGEWRWRLRAANGEIVASSEGYHGSAGDAEEGVYALGHAVVGSGLVEAANPEIEILVGVEGIDDSFVIERVS